MWTPDGPQRDLDTILSQCVIGLGDTGNHKDWWSFVISHCSMRFQYDLRFPALLEKIDVHLKGQKFTTKVEYDGTKDAGSERKTMS